MWFATVARGRPAAVLLAVLGVSLLLAGGHSYSIDEETYLANLRSLLHFERAVESAPGMQLLTVPAKDGQPTSFYGIGTAVFTAPAYVVGKGASFLVASDQRELVLRLVYFSTNSFVIAGTAATLVLIGMRIGASQRTSTLVAFCYATGTYALAQAKTGWSEPLTALFLTLAFLGLLVLREQLPRSWAPEAIGLMVGCATMMRSSAVVFIPIFAVAVLSCSLTPARLPNLLRMGLGASLPCALVAFNNWWRFGSVWDNGYPPLNYNTPIYEGIFGLLASPGKGLFWFAPITLLAVVKSPGSLKASPLLAGLLWSCIAANMAIFSRFEIWSGDNSYGPRYMGIVLPFFAILVLLSSVVNPINKHVVATWLLGMTLTLSGSLVYFNAVYAHRVSEIIAFVGTSATNSDGSYNWSQVRNDINFTPRYSQLVMHNQALPDVARHLGGLNLRAPQVDLYASGPQTQLSWYQSGLRLDTWWAYWLELGAPKRMLLLLIAPLASFVVGIRLLRSSGSRESSF